MEHQFRTKQEAIEAGYRPVNRQADTDTSGPNSFGYSYRNKAGEETVTVWLTEDLNQLRQPGCFVPMYPPAN